MDDSVAVTDEQIVTGSTKSGQYDNEVPDNVSYRPSEDNKPGMVLKLIFSKNSL